MRAGYDSDFSATEGYVGMSSGHNVPLNLGGSITDLSVTDGCRRRCSDEIIMGRAVRKVPVNIDHIKNN